MGQYYVHCRTQIQAKVRRDVNEAMTKAPNDLRYASVFRAEKIDCVFGMLERCQRFTLLEDFDADWREILEQTERALVVAELHPLISLHSLFAREAAILRSVDARAGPDE